MAEAGDGGNGDVKVGRAACAGGTEFADEAGGGDTLGGSVCGIGVVVAAVCEMVSWSGTAEGAVLLSFAVIGVG